MIIGFLDTAGERVSFESAVPWVSELVAEGAAGELSTDPVAEASVRVRIEADRRAFAVAEWEPLTRGAWRRNGEVVVENACTAGFDLHARCSDESVELTYRWRPPRRDRVAARVLRSRFHLLARAVLSQYPALWWAGTRGRVPLHASACTVGGAVPLIGAAGGVGRSTLLLRELELGGSVTGDNLVVGDGTTVWGLVEPLRVEGGEGRRMPHGRQETTIARRAGCLVPDRLVVLRRLPEPRSTLRACSPAEAARSLAAATYMAGELRRYWSFAATLGAGTGAGPAHPQITAASSAFAERVPCFTLALGRDRASLSDLLTSLAEAA